MTDDIQFVFFVLVCIWACLIGLISGLAIYSSVKAFYLGKEVQAISYRMIEQRLKLDRINKYVNILLGGSKPGFDPGVKPEA